jgi:hypothetical protein
MPGARRRAPALPSLAYAGEAARGLVSRHRREADARALASQLGRVEAIVNELQADHELYRGSLQFVFDRCDPIYFELLERRRHRASPVPDDVITSLEAELVAFKQANRRTDGA